MMLFGRALREWGRYANRDGTGTAFTGISWHKNTTLLWLTILDHRRSRTRFRAHVRISKM
jgi:hypothetical protein